MSITEGFFLDLSILVGCSFVLLLWGKLPKLHPAFILIPCHVYTVTLRLGAIWLGRYPSALLPWPVSIDEVVRAGMASDLALLSMTVVWLLMLRPNDARVKSNGSYRMLSKRFTIVVSSLFVIVGLVGMYFFGHPANGAGLDELSPLQKSGYLFPSWQWAGWACCVLHYMLGFPLWLDSLTVIILGLTSINGSRFATILPALLLCLIWISRNSKTRIQLRVIVVSILLVVIWFPLKPVGMAVREGKQVGEIRAILGAYLDEQLVSNSGRGGGDTQFLDATAAAMTLADFQEPFYGSSILPIFVAPVPRAWWPGKPPPNEYQIRISTPSRPMSTLGMTSGIIGEGYIDFRYGGVALFAGAMAYAYGWGHRRAVRGPPGATAHILYLLWTATAVQVYRDGVISALTFPLVQAAPVAIIAALHYVLPRRGPATPKRGYGFSSTRTLISVTDPHFSRSNARFTARVTCD